jgi:hypothetical protein
MKELQRQNGSQGKKHRGKLAPQQDFGSDGLFEHSLLGWRE